MNIDLLSLFLALFPQTSAVHPGPGADGVVDLVEVRTPGPRERELLRRFATDVDDHFHAPDRARILADDREQGRLVRLGLELEVLQEDLVGFYAARIGEQAQLSSGGSFGGYRPWPEMRTDMILLAAQYPDVVSPPMVLGHSVEGREILALRISDTPNVHDPSKPTVWIDGLHHAREPISGEVVLRLAEHLVTSYGNDPEVRALVDGRNLLLIPCVNPDGYEFNYLLMPSGGGVWRKNMAQNADGTLGVDLNRNYDWEWGPQWSGSSGSGNDSQYRGPSPFSEPESRALATLAALSPPDLSISCHAYGHLCVLPWSYDAQITPDDALLRDYADLLTGPMGWEHGCLWETMGFANGTSVDFQYGQHGTLALAFEIGDDQDGFWPTGARIDELCDEVLPALMLAVRLVGPAPRVAEARLLEVAGDGDAWKEAGEVWGVEARLTNDGMKPSTGELWLTTPPDLVGSSSAPQDYTLAPQAQVQLLFAFEISTAAPDGATLQLGLHLAGEELHEELQLPLALGEGHLLAHDGGEGGDLGWTTEASGSGAWECADPELVIDPTSGSTTQPDLDGAGDATGRAWTTGAQAGASATSHDVGGTTRLVSPRFRLGGHDHAELRYRRWFASLPESGPGDDLLRVELSNDDGASWALVEELGSARGWASVSFDLGGVAELSDAMRLRLTVSDEPDDDLTEALLDELELWVVSDLPTLGLWGRTAAGDSPRLFVHSPEQAGQPFRVRRSLQAGPGVSVPGAEGLWHLEGPTLTVGEGTLDSEGRAELTMGLAPYLHPVGRRVFLQLSVGGNGGQVAFSKLVELAIE
jgi:hypothetical protein